MWALMILPGATWRVSKATTEIWGVIVMGIGAQVVFPSILLVRGKGVRRKALILPINNWL